MARTKDQIRVKKGVLKSAKNPGVENISDNGEKIAPSCVGRRGEYLILKCGKRDEWKNLAKLSTFKLKGIEEPQQKV